MKYIEDSPLRSSFAYSLSILLILAALKSKLYMRFKTYTFSNGLFSDMPSILFCDFVLALTLFVVFYFLKILLGRIGSFLAEVTYTMIMVFSILSTITYLRLGAPINAGMIGDIRYDFLKSSIEQQTDIKLLLVKMVVFIIIGLLLPHVLKRILKIIIPRHSVLTLSSFIILPLLLPAYLNANRLGEPDLWKTPIQAFVGPVLEEYSYAKVKPGELQKFSFQSPFNSQLQKQYPIYDFQPQNHNVIIYLMEGVPLKVIKDTASQGFLPNIEILLKRSFSVSHYYTTAADSTKSVFSILTSMYPFPGYKKMTNIANELFCQSLPKILRDNGYSTAIISSGSFSWDNTQYFFEDHFDHTIDPTTASNKNEYDQFSWGLDDKFLVDQLDKLLATNKGPHFILMVPTNTHHPYFTPDEKFNFYPKGDSMNYLKNSIAYQDNIIGLMYKVLKDHDVADNTITIVTSDHSVRFDYDKAQKKGKPQISPVEEQIAIPFIFSHPAVKEKFLIDTIGSHVDIAPTVLKVLGFSTDARFQGINLFQKNHASKVDFIISTVKGFDIILRDAEFQYYFDISNNRIAIRHKNLSFSGQEYLPTNFPIRDEVYREMCIQFIQFQRQYLKTILPVKNHTRLDQKVNKRKFS